MSDLIERSAAIAALTDAFKNSLIGQKTATDSVKALPAVEPMRWIPCNERMPNPAKHVLVTLKWGEDDYEVTEMDVGVDMACGSRFVKHMIAWCELPAPYKGGDVDG